MSFNCTYKEKLAFWGKIVYNKRVIFSKKTQKTLLNDILVCADCVGEWVTLTKNERKIRCR